MAGGDGRLTHDLIPGEKAPQDACGVFGVWAPGEEVAKLTYFGLYALQHRGQESAGIATSDGSRLLVYKDMGLVSQVFDERSAELAARATSRSGTAATPPPAPAPGRTPSPPSAAATGGTVALAHNGNLTNSAELRDRLDARNGEGCSGTSAASCAAATPPTPPWSPRCSTDDPDRSLEATALDVLPQLRGAFCFVFMDEHTLYAARDPHGIRPLVLGRLERGWVVASETAALDIVGASLHPRGRAGRAHRDRRRRPAHPAVRRGRPQGLRLRVRLPGPPGHHDQRPRRARGPGRDGPPAGARAPGRGRPGHPHARVRHPGRDRLRPGVRHPLRPGPGQELLRRPHLHRSRARPSASSASGSSSTRSRTSSAASGWSSSTTRSCAATPSAPWCGCCARPARPRCTCASPPRR